MKPTTEQQPLGSILREPGRTGLRYERHLRHAPTLVWQAITEHDHLQAWLPTDIVGERRAGATITLPFWPAVIEQFGTQVGMDDTTYDGEINVWDPPHTFEWTWGGDVIRFDLDAVDDGTQLTLTTWLGPAPVEAWQAAAGWHSCLALLVQLLDTGSAPGAGTVVPDDWETTYRDLFATG